VCGVKKRRRYTPSQSVVILIHVKKVEGKRREGEEIYPIPINVTLQKEDTMSQQEVQLELFPVKKTKNTCGQCGGTGAFTYKSGALGVCYRCQGKGVLNSEDKRRNWWYDEKNSPSRRTR